MKPSLAIVLPCLNEERALPLLLSELDNVLATERVLVVVVDDGSSDGTRKEALEFKPKNPELKVEVIALLYSTGHQEAIYHGLHFASGSSAENFLVMDGDGQDDPMAIPDMLAASAASIVLVARGERSESMGFRLGYQLYRLLFRLVAGRSINFGNYSMIDRAVLGAVLDRSFVHYAAFLSKQNASTATVRSNRRPRLAGSSKMAIDDLGLHAFRSLVEYSDRLLMLLLKLFLYLSVVFLLSVLTIVGIKVFTDLAIPGWASNLSATMFNSLLVCIGFFVIGLLLTKSTQQRERLGRVPYTRIEREA